MTDVAEMLGAYHTLFSALQVDVGDLVFQPQSGFTHPIEEENRKMTSEFMGTMTIIQGAVANHHGIKLVNSRVQNTQVTFLFEYNE